jgi:hypothetical protein
MRFHKYFAVFAAALFAPVMMVALGGCFYGGHDDHRDRGYDYHHDEGMRPVPAVNSPKETISVAAPKANANRALLTLRSRQS